MKTKARKIKALLNNDKKELRVLKLEAKERRNKIKKVARKIIKWFFISVVIILFCLFVFVGINNIIENFQQKGYTCKVLYKWSNEKGTTFFLIEVEENKIETTVNKATYIGYDVGQNIFYKLDKATIENNIGAMWFNVLFWVIIVFVGVIIIIFVIMMIIEFFKKVLGYE